MYGQGWVRFYSLIKNVLNNGATLIKALNVLTLIFVYSILYVHSLCLVTHNVRNYTGDVRNKLPVTKG